MLSIIYGPFEEVTYLRESGRVNIIIDASQGIYFLAEYFLYERDVGHKNSPFIKTYIHTEIDFEPMEDPEHPQEELTYFLSRWYPEEPKQSTQLLANELRDYWKQIRDNYYAVKAAGENANA